jgi:TolB-like protein/Flp pilus assembly protein TadD
MMTGKQISHYTILEKIGEGGMGVVYKAEDTKLKRAVAIKFLTLQLTLDPEAKERFINEARAASALEHHNICTIHEIDETGNGQTFMVMACYDGESLDEKIQRGPLRIEEAVDIALQIAQGLNKAHEKDIVHRDIKPANILITVDGVVKILDFGLAKLRGQTKVTREGTTLGTVSYMSPEQTKGDEVDQRSDIWSLGVVLYEMITGQTPFRGDYEQAVMYSILNEDPKPITGLRTGVPIELERLVNKTLVKNPVERYQQLDEILVDLRAITKTPESKEITLGQTKAKRSKITRKYIYAGIIIILFILLAGRYFLFPGGLERAKAINSIAVLPLENLSGDPEQDYFSDGMTEAVIAELGKIKPLRVISRTTVMRYKETDKSLPEIAGELNVDAIVEGSVLRAEDQVRITAQLIEARVDRHIWTDSYERNLQDVLKLQREVAQDIAREIRISLTEQEEGILASATSIDPEAHEAYLKGRFHWNKRTKEGLEKSVDLFERAIAYDPEYALAYAGLADAYIVLADLRYRTPRDCYPQAKELVEKALQIDEHLAEAYTTRAYITAMYEWRWTEAEAGFKRAIELNSNYATAHQWYSEYLNCLGRFDEAIQEAQEAQELDPLSVMIHTNAGILFYNAGQFDRAVEQFRKALDIDDDFYWALLYRAHSLEEQGQYDEAFEGYVKALQVYELSKEKAAELQQIYNTKGLEGYYRWFVDDGFEELNALDILRDHFIASCAYLGETDLAFEWLERDVQERCREVVEMGVIPAFTKLRSDPRFADLLRRMGLAQ